MVNKDYIDKSEEKNPDRTVFHPVGVWQSEWRSSQTNSATGHSWTLYVTTWYGIVGSPVAAVSWWVHKGIHDVLSYVLLSTPLSSSVLNSRTTQCHSNPRCCLMPLPDTCWSSLIAPPPWWMLGLKSEGLSLHLVSSFLTQWSACGQKCSQIRPFVVDTKGFPESELAAVAMAKRFCCVWHGVACRSPSGMWCSACEMAADAACWSWGTGCFMVYEQCAGCCVLTDCFNICVNHWFQICEEDWGGLNL